MKKSHIIISGEEQRKRALYIIEHLSIEFPMKVTIEKHVKKRSLSQNALYHKWIDILGDHFGYERDEMAEELKRMFVPAQGRVTKKALDGGIREFCTTTKLNTAEMKEYMNAIDRFAAQNNVILPHPEDLQRHY